MFRGLIDPCVSAVVSDREMEMSLTGSAAVVEERVPESSMASGTSSRKFL